MKILSKKKPLPQPSEPATLAPIAEYHARKSAEEAASYKRRNGASGILRAVKEGGEIRLNTLKELLELLETKTDSSTSSLEAGFVIKCKETPRE